MTYYKVNCIIEDIFLERGYMFMKKKEIFNVQKWHY